MQAAPLHLRGMNAHMLGGFDLQTRVTVRAVVDVDFVTGESQFAIDGQLPFLADHAELFVRRGKAEGDELLILKF